MKKIFFAFALMFILSATTTNANINEPATDVNLSEPATNVRVNESATMSSESLTLEISVQEEELASSPTKYVIDDASLLTEDQVKTLEAKSAEIRKNYNFDAIILTVPDIYSKTPMAYSKNFFHSNGYGEDGIIFLISMADRDWDISTFNYGRDVFTDSYGLDYIVDNVVSSLSDGDYNKSFSKFLNYVDEFLLEAKSGTPYDTDNKFIQKNKIMLFIVIGAFIFSAIALGLMVFSMNTKRPKDLVHEYVNRESINMTERKDVFLYRTVTKTAKPKKSSSGSGGGGRIGGRSGKF